MECRAVTTSAISKGHAAYCPAELFPFQTDASPGLVMVVMRNPHASLRHSGPPAGLNQTCLSVIAKYTQGTLLQVLQEIGRSFLAKEKQIHVLGPDGD